MSNIYSLPPRGAASDAPAPGFSSVDELLAELRAGRMVIILDDEDRENEGDLIMAAEHATPDAVTFMIRHTSGIICVPLEDERLEQLDLPQMVPNNDDAFRTAFTVSVDYRFGTTTGVSSNDRSATIKALANPASAAADFARPGHIFPLRPRKGGVLVRAGHTEAAVDLCRLAGLRPAGVLCELMNDDGTMQRRAEIEGFARRHNLKIGTIADLIRYRLRNERSVERISEQNVKTEYGEFRLYAYEDHVQQVVHLALAHGPLDGKTPPLVRVHRADTLRDLLGIRFDPHAWTLRAALERIAHAGSGVVVILRAHESAMELTEALRALGPSTSRAEAGPDESGAQKAGPTRGVGPGGEVLRTYGIGAQILKDLGVHRMRVLSLPKQLHGISAFGLEIDGYVSDGS
ncbi:MAG TPA: 3,4-dihydroxy-2-butanone-4-phosphate synthase [Steroidobacteraceae bacterium]|jgi:3,4-dihydroxy 2-butanone 4-phosphate synthase/GTP cyclohydrolase II